MSIIEKIKKILFSRHYNDTVDNYGKLAHSIVDMYLDFLMKPKVKQHVINFMVKNEDSVKQISSAVQDLAKAIKSIDKSEISAMEQTLKEFCASHEETLQKDSDELQKSAADLMNEFKQA